MTDPSADPDTGVAPARGSTTGTPRWVKVFGVVALVVVVLFVILLVTGRGGGHGPGRHTLSRDDAAPSTVTEDHTPPPGAQTQRSA